MTRISKYLLTRVRHFRTKSDQNPWCAQIAPWWFWRTKVQDRRKIQASHPRRRPRYPRKKMVFCCYNCLDLQWEKFSQMQVIYFPSSWQEEHCVEKRFCKFETEGQELVTFKYRRYSSCLWELGIIITGVRPEDSKR